MEKRKEQTTKVSVRSTSLMDRNRALQEVRALYDDPSHQTNSNVVDHPHRRTFEALVRSEERLRLACTCGNVGVWDRDLASDDEYWSEEYCALYGVNKGNFKSSYANWLQLIHPADRMRVNEEASSAIGNSKRYSIEFRVLHPTRGLRWLAEMGHPRFEDGATTPTRFMGIAIDITERKLAEVRLATEHSVTQILSRSEKPEEAIPAILEVVRECFQASLAQYWSLQEREQCLICQVSAPTSSANLEEFVRQSQKLKLSRGQGLPGTVWQQHCPLWIENLTALEFPRQELSKLNNLRNAVAFPIANEGHFFGVMEFLTTDVLSLDRGLLGMLEAIGSEVAQYLLRKIAEDNLRRHREHLEDLVRERTAELERSNQKLRISERMATIGTLSAGLGHDMANLLLPLRTRLDMMERKLKEADIDETHLIEDITSIRKSTEYLQKLSKGLRLLALNPDDLRASSETADLYEWWKDVEPLFRNILPRSVLLKSAFAEGLPPLAIPKHRLTQAVFNLVQNAGDVLRSQPLGTVTVTAKTGSNGQIEVLVKDNGPGMSEEVRARCIEPFYTTKHRGVSTGLGLSLVHSIVQASSGELEIDSKLGDGATFIMRLPKSVQSVNSTEEEVASVMVADNRLASYIRSVFNQHGVRVTENGVSNSVYLVTDEKLSDATLKEFVDLDGGRTALCLASFNENEALNHPRIVCLPSPKASALREAISNLVRNHRKLSRDEVVNS